MTGIVQAGVPQSSSFSATAPILWTLSPQPTSGNGLIIPYCVENPVNLGLQTVGITDNAGNVYSTQYSVSNLNGNGTLGAMAVGFITCPSVVYAGTLTLSVLITGGGGRFSYLFNQIETNGMKATTDHVGVYSSGSTSVLNALVQANGQNAQPNDIVIAALMIFNKNGQFAVASDPPSAGYTSCGYVSLAANNPATLTTTADMGYKTESGLVTSTAQWPASGNWGFNGVALAAIATFSPAPFVPPNPGPMPSQLYVMP